MPEQPKKLLDVVRNTLRIKHYSFRTEQSYVDWIMRYILFQNGVIMVSESCQHRSAGEPNH